MRRGLHTVVVAVLACIADAANAANPSKLDPDWPCFQVRVPTISLNSVWVGPPLDVTSRTWPGDSGLADLVAKMVQRRVPVADAETAIAEFAKKPDPEAKAKLLYALGVAFQELTRQRTQIIDGLMRFGRRQREMADKIRAESEAVQSAPGDGSDVDAQNRKQKLQWDLRVFEDRHRTITYVCEAPTLIEQRIGVLARAVQKTL